MTPPTFSPATLRAHVQTLAGDIGERNVNRPAALTRAARYLEDTWRAQGYAVTRQPFTAHGVECVNLAVERPGTTRTAEIIVIGAHYDSVCGSPGANDNATGIAALLELSRVFAAQTVARTVRFVAFPNEELFKTEAMGSRHYARACRQRGDDLRAMVSLETIGHYTDAPGSQSYPPFFRWFYPDRGNFLAFVSDLDSRAVMHEAVAAFRAHTDFPVECCATFAAVPGVDWSDHFSFWEQGYRAFMVTDTAPYRYPHYHEATDAPDRVNYEALARLLPGLAGAVAALAGTSGE
jgi:Zn-dependent M28 family amino/carboxypeptidase